MRKFLLLLCILGGTFLFGGDTARATDAACDESNKSYTVCGCLEYRFKEEKADGYCVKEGDKIQWYARSEDGSAKKTNYYVNFQEEIMGSKGIGGDTGVELVGNYISLIYKYGASIIGIIAVLVIVISGVQIILGGVDSEMVTEAKNRIFQAILSIILLFLSAAILYTINPGFFTTAT